MILEETTVPTESKHAMSPSEVTALIEWSLSSDRSEIITQTIDPIDAG